MVDELGFHDAYIKHAEHRPAGGAEAATPQPCLGAGLILAAGKPTAHAVQAPHWPTQAALALSH